MIRLALVGTLGSALFLGACSDDHDLLAADPRSNTGHADASSSDATRDQSSGEADDASENSDAGAPDGAGTPDDGDDATAEPTGPTAITILNGVVDSASVRLCFAPIAGHTENIAAAVSVPSTAAPLAFAAHVALSALPTIDTDTTDVHPYVVAGDPEAVMGGACADLLAAPSAGNAPESSSEGGPADAAEDSVDGDEPSDDGAHDESDGGDAEAGADSGPPIRVLSLPVIPAGTLAAGRSYLLAIYGCVGGPGHVDSAQTAICGAGYTSTTPTLTLLLVKLSRIVENDALGLQALHASLATPDLTVKLLPSGGLSGWALTGDLSPGSIMPHTPLTTHNLAELGVAPLDATLDVQTRDGTGARADVGLSTALSLGGLDVAALADGRSYTFVLLGAAPSVTVSGFGRPFTAALLENDPALTP